MVIDTARTPPNLRDIMKFFPKKICYAGHKLKTNIIIDYPFVFWPIKLHDSNFKYAWFERVWKIQEINILTKEIRIWYLTKKPEQSDVYSLVMK